MARLPDLDGAQSTFVTKLLPQWSALQGHFSKEPFLWAWWTPGGRKSRLMVEVIKSCRTDSRTDTVIVTFPSLLLLRQFFRDYVRGNLAYMGLRRDEVVMVCSHRTSRVSGRHAQAPPLVESDAEESDDNADDTDELDPLRWTDNTEATVRLGSTLSACPRGARLVLSTFQSLHHVAEWENTTVAALVIDEADLNKGWSGRDDVSTHASGFPSVWRKGRWKNTYGEAAQKIIDGKVPTLLLTASRNPELLAVCGPDTGRCCERTHRDAVEDNVCVPLEPVCYVTHTTDGSNNKEALDFKFRCAIKEIIRNALAAHTFGTMILAGRTTSGGEYASAVEDWAPLDANIPSSEGAFQQRLHAAIDVELAKVRDEPDAQEKLERLRKARKLRVRAMHGGTPTRVREKIVREFREGRCVVVACRVMSRGFDAPLCGSVVLADPRRNEADLQQILGRTTRTAKHKTCGRVVMCFVASMEVYTAAAGDHEATTAALARNWKTQGDYGKMIRVMSMLEVGHTTMPVLKVVTRDGRVVVEGSDDTGIEENKDGDMVDVSDGEELSDDILQDDVGDAAGGHVGGEDDIIQDDTVHDTVHDTVQDDTVHDTTQDDTVHDTVQDTGDQTRDTIDLTGESKHQRSTKKKRHQYTLTPIRPEIHLEFRDPPEELQRSLRKEGVGGMVAAVIRICRDGDERFAQTLDEVVEFCNAQNRVPKQGSKDDNEARLATWITNQNKARKLGSGIWNEREHLFKKAHPLLAERLRQWKDLNWNFKKTLEEVVEFCNAQNRVPKQGSKDDNEARLGAWITNQNQVRQGKGNGIWNDERGRLFQKAHPLLAKRLRQGKDPDWNFKETLEEIVEFCNAQKRVPKQKSKGDNECRLAMWINYQNQARQGKGERTWNDERECLFREAHPLLAARLLIWSVADRVGERLHKTTQELLKMPVTDPAITTQLKSILTDHARLCKPFGGSKLSLRKLQRVFKQQLKQKVKQEKAAAKKAAKKAVRVAAKAVKMATRFAKKAEKWANKATKAKKKKSKKRRTCSNKKKKRRLDTTSDDDAPSTTPNRMEAKATEKQVHQKTLSATPQHKAKETSDSSKKKNHRLDTTSDDTTSDDDIPLTAFKRKRTESTNARPRKKRSKHKPFENLTPSEKYQLARQAYNARYREPAAYGASHTSAHRQFKTEMNKAFAEAVDSEGLVVVLDDDTHPAFGTSTMLKKRYPDIATRLHIPQIDAAKAERMRNHPDFGDCVTHEGGAAAIRRLIPKNLRAAYYDSCQHLDTVCRALEGLRFPKGFVLGVTWIEDRFSGPKIAGNLCSLLSSSGAFECVKQQSHTDACTVKTMIVRYTG